MNTMYVRIILLAAIMLSAPSLLSAEESKRIDSTFNLTVEISCGYTSHSINDDDSSDISRWGITPSLRILWEPNHRLNLGLETALIHILDQSGTKSSEEFGETNFEASLDAIPILLVFNMEVWEIEFNVGMGVSYVWSTLDAFDVKVRSHEWDYCLSTSWEYSYRITKDFAVGAEFKTYFITKLEKTIGGIMLKAQYSFLEW